MSTYDMIVEASFKKGVEEGIGNGFEKGIEEGIEKGIEKGFEKGKAETVIKAFDNDFKIADIMLFSDLSENQIIEILTKNGRM
jgi:predicted transposase/invertase (TIGR01784 family)